MIESPYTRVSILLVLSSVVLGAILIKKRRLSRDGDQNDEAEHQLQKLSAGTLISLRRQKPFPTRLLGILTRRCLGTVT